MGDRARQLDAVGLDGTVEHGARAVVGAMIKLSCSAAIDCWSPSCLTPLWSHQNNAERNARAATCRLRNTWPSRTCWWLSLLRVLMGSGSVGQCTRSSGF